MPQRQEGVYHALNGNEDIHSGNTAGGRHVP